MSINRDTKVDEEKKKSVLKLIEKWMLELEQNKSGKEELEINKKENIRDE
ncbi:hypothetical protein JOC75_000560 [Metabacillus crassostreae]|nr:hypothetical protein [Metabacillus crassostreae]MBM7602590.1 hypothetical protein [Metabacillus crassostreae]